MGISIPTLNLKKWSFLSFDRIEVPVSASSTLLHYFYLADHDLSDIDELVFRLDIQTAGAVLTADVAVDLNRSTVLYQTGATFGGTTSFFEFIDVSSYNKSYELGVLLDLVNTDVVDRKVDFNQFYVYGKKGTV